MLRAMWLNNKALTSAAWTDLPEDVGIIDDTIAESHAND